MSTLCHSCGFACQQRLLKTFPGPGYLRSEDGVAWLWHLLVNVYTYIHIYTYMCVLTINSEMDVSGLSSFPIIGHGNTIIFDTRKTLCLKEAPTKFLKTYLKDIGNICFVAV